MIKFKNYSKAKDSIHEAIDWHLKNNTPLTESIYRVGSENYFKLWQEARTLYRENKIQLNSIDKYIIENTDIGEIVCIEGNYYPLDCPMIEESTESDDDKELNKPKRGGTKKFYVYVRTPEGNIKKVSWGDTTGLKVKMNDPEARKSFAARHQCDQQTDKTTAAYWACRTPYYAKSLGLSGGGNFYW